MTAAMAHIPPPVHIYGPRRPGWFLVLLPLVWGATLPLGLLSFAGLIRGIGAVGLLGLIGLQLGWLGLLFPRLARETRPFAGGCLAVGLLVAVPAGLLMALRFSSAYWLAAPVSLYAVLAAVFLYGLVRGVPVVEPAPALPQAPTPVPIPPKPALRAPQAPAAPPAKVLPRDPDPLHALYQAKTGHRWSPQAGIFWLKQHPEVLQDSWLQMAAATRNRMREIHDLYTEATGRPWSEAEGTAWLKANPKILDGGKVIEPPPSRAPANAGELKALYKACTGKTWTAAEGTQWLRENPAALRGLTGYAAAAHLGASPALLPAAARFPRVYRITALWRIVLTTFGLPMLGGGLFYARYCLQARHDQPGLDIGPGWAILFILIAAYGTVLLLYALRYRVVLFEDAVEVHGPILSRRLERDDIAGRRAPWRPGARHGVVHGSGNLLIPRIDLQSRAGPLKSIRIYQIFRMDPAFKDWMNSIPEP